MSYSKAEIDLLLELISQSATLEQASDFLRSRNLHHSGGSWEFLRERRFRPALADGSLQVEDLVSLLSRSEEYGRQHVFLYKCRGGAQRAKLLMQSERIEQELERLKVSDVLERPRLVEMPSSPTIVDARWEDRGDDRRFVLKIVEKRRTKNYLGDETRGNRYIKRWELEEVRAVNVFCLHANGMLELRVFSHKNSSKYDDDRKRLWSLAGGLLLRRDVNSWNILQAKDTLWARKKRYGKQIRYWTTSFRNDVGTTLRASTGQEQQSLFGDTAATSSVDTFAKRGGYCDSIVVHWLGKDQGNRVGPERTVLVRLTGDAHEYAVVAQCSPNDHEFILQKILELNTT